MTAPYYNGFLVPKGTAGYDSFEGVTVNSDYITSEVATNVQNYNDLGHFIALAGALVTKHSDILDPKDKNIGIGEKSCSLLNLCVPTVNVPDATKKLYQELEYDSEGHLITPYDEIISKILSDYADDIGNLDDYVVPKVYFDKTEVNKRFDENELIPVPDEIHVPNSDTLNSREPYDKLDSNGQIELTTQETVACRPETIKKPTDIPDETLDQSDEMDCMLHRLNELMNVDNVEPEIPVNTVTVDELTERSVNGNGVFDWLSKALLNQIEYGINEKQLFTKADAKGLYANALAQLMEQSVAFSLQKEQSNWQSFLIKNQITNANIQALAIKAELALAPTKVKLAYAELQHKLKQMDLLNQQIEAQKYQIPQIVAQTDQIREQTALICQQRKLAIEQLAQAEFDRKIKQEQIVGAQVQNQILMENLTKERLGNKLLEEQVVQAKQQSKQLVQQTKLLMAQTEKTNEETRMVNTQVANGLKDLKIKDAQLITMQAQLKVQSQQILKEKEKTALVKAQTASQYAGITLAGEQIKASRAQYSDTLDGEPIGGVLGAQMNVNKAQAIGFEREGFNKFYQQVQAGWSTKKTADMATLSPSAFNALGVDRLSNWYAQKYFNMPNDMFEMPDGYRDYLSDSELEGKSPTPNPGSSKV